MNLKVRQMTMQDYDSVVELWTDSEGIGLSQADSAEGINRFLERNPELSFVALRGENVVGAVICGHDGRRGFIHHLVVRADQRRQGIGKNLVECCLIGLRANRIDKVHIFIYRANEAAKDFWKVLDFYPRHELLTMSADLKDEI